jgi:hypothetical protein
MASLNKQNSDAITIPSWDELRRKYDHKWLEKKEAFWKQLKENYAVLVGEFRTGRQEIFELTEGELSPQFEKAFRELFSDTGYQASVGEMERLGSGTRKSRKLYIRLPDSYNGTA